MSICDDLIGFYRTQKGVFDIIELTDDQFREVHSIESGIVTQAGQEYENVGFEVISRRKHKFCLYVDSDFKFEKKSRLVMMNGDAVTGMLLSEDEVPMYMGREDVIWVSDDFIVFPDIELMSEDRFVLYPYEFNELSEIVPGCVDAVGTSPAVPSDWYLKQIVGIKPDSKIFTFILGIDMQD